MTDEHARDVERLFQQAADLPQDARASFLDQHCPPGSDVRREIEELLEHLDAGGATLPSSPLGDARSSTVRPSELLLPDAIGRYLIRSQLGRGGMGVVYLGLDPELEREVALKVLPPELSADPDWQERMRREARMLAAINHPNIATVYSLEMVTGVHFLTMELVEGDLLAGLIQREGLPLDAVLPIVQQVAAALEAAHKKGVVHRDLKPLNVMVTPDGLVKVLDFGLARSVRGGTALTAADHVAGTPGYMSPEQLRGERVDHRTDIWAFGCVVFECLTGGPAFPGASAADRISATLNLEPDWTRLPPDTPRRIRDLIARCLVKDSGDRLGIVTWARREIEEAIAVRARQGAIGAVGEERAAPAGNLPLSLTTFVGRRKEIVALESLLASARLVTVTGAGGCGKSRLTLEVARRMAAGFPDDAWFVDLASISDPDLVARAVASALRLRDVKGRSVPESIIEFLGDKHLLLLLDNTEHLLEPTARLVEAILQSCPRLRVLVTSRENLGIAGEATFFVPSLEMPAADAPATADRVIGSDAVRLFADRARAVVPGFELTDDNAAGVVAICRRLDGIPLAIELAAARARVLPVDEIARRLDDRFRLLTTGSKTSLPRHRTLRALIDWSHDLLEPGERALLRRLSAFAGGWTLDAAEEVCAGDGIEPWEVLDSLSRLLDKSLVEMVASRSDSEPVRYRMLESVREYAFEHLLSTGEVTSLRKRHCDFFVTLAEEARSHIGGGPRQQEWLERLDSEHDNLRVAIETAMREPADVRAALRLTAPVSTYLNFRGSWEEGRRLCDEVLALPGARSTATADLGRVLHEAGRLAQARNDSPAAHALYDEAREVWRKTGNDRSLAGTINNKGLLHMNEGHYEEAARLFTEALTINRRIGNRAWEGTNLTNLGVTASENGRFDEALGYYEQALAIAREAGDRGHIAILLDNLAINARFRKDMPRARALHEESLAIYRDLGHRRGIGIALMNLATLLHELGETGRAHALLRESLEIRHELGDPRGVVFVLESLVDVFLDRGEPDRGARLLGASARIRKEIGMPPSPTAQTMIDRITAALRDRIGDDAFATAWSRGERMSTGEAVSLALEPDHPSG